MILYVNGDSHSAGAEAVNSHAFAMDDPLYWALGRRPHPDNERASYGCEIANMMGAILECDAESASSNQRIIRTTWDRLQGVQGLPTIKPDFVIIGWSTWEREEWLHEGTYHQVTASGTDQVPLELHNRYKKWVVEQDENMREEKMLKAHNSIYNLHGNLTAFGIPHLFFNTYSNFAPIRLRHLKSERGQLETELEWDGCYLEPYDQNYSYYYWCLANGFKTVSPDSYHFGHDAHCAWAEYLYQTIVQKILTK